MKRAALCLALFTVACTDADEGSAFEHQAVIHAPTRGIALSDDGSWGVAGMWETTCEFDTRFGALGTDHDVLDTEDERIVDLRDRAGEQRALAVSSRGVHLIDRSAWDADVTDVWLGSALDARFADDDIVALRSGSSCSLDWLGAGISVPLWDGTCGSAVLSYDARDGVAFVSTRDQIWRVEAGQASHVSELGGDLVRWNETSGTLMVAESGQQTITALEADGTVLWQTEIEVPLRGMDDLGTDGAVAVVGGSDSSGILRVLDASTGELRADLATPAAALDVVASGDGELLGLVLPHEVHLFRAIASE